MEEEDKGHLNCRCWRCWVQDNFTSLALFTVVIIGLALTTVMIHESSVDDKYVTWFEGFVAGAFSTWTLALKSGPDRQHSDMIVPAPQATPPTNSKTTTSTQSTTVIPAPDAPQKEPPQ